MKLELGKTYITSDGKDKITIVKEYTRKDSGQLLYEGDNDYLYNVNGKCIHYLRPRLLEIQKVTIDL